MQTTRLTQPIQHFGRRGITTHPQTKIIVYDQPKVVIVRHYTHTVIPRVNPDDYRQKYEAVLLDTSTLLEWTRRLNIQDHMITPTILRQKC